MKKFTVVFAIGLILLAAGCGQREPSGEIVGEAAKVITHKTDGVIPKDGVISVRFLDEKVTDAQVGVALKGDYFKFSPEIEGSAEWRNKNIIVFKPNRPLKMTQLYEGYLDLDKLFPDEDLPIDRVEILFQVEGRIVQSFKADLELLDKNEPTEFKLRGVITFNTETKLEDLKSSMDFKLNDKKLLFEITPDAGNSFRFETETIVRSSIRKKIFMAIHPEPLEMGNGFYRDFKLPPLRSFELTDALDMTAGDDAFVELTFSDDLDAKADYSGFIRVEPETDVTIKANGKKMILRGAFEFGELYTIKVLEGMTSRWGTKTGFEKTWSVEFPDILPQIAFTSEGAFLPSSNSKNLNFRTVNVERVSFKIMRIYENNLCFFLQDNSIRAPKDRHGSFYNTHRVGVQVAAETLYIGKNPNRWLQSQINLGKIMEKFDKGLYLVELSFGEDDDLVSLPEDWHSWRHWDYYYNNGRISKPLILTDVGLSAKSTKDGLIVIANNVLNTKPLAGVEVKLRSYQNQIIARGTTNSEGICHFDSSRAYFIEADYRGSRSVLVMDDSYLSTSLFEVGGATDIVNEIRAFTYTERGVYRPGDTINLCVIARNQNNTFPDDHPATLKLYDPKNRPVLERTIKKAVEGYYDFEIYTLDNSPTGNWKAEISIGERKFTHGLKIETVVPYRLKVNVESDLDRITNSDKEWPVTLTSKYLFGNPAKRLECELAFSVYPAPKRFERYGGFVFEHKGMEFEPVTSPTYSKTLDSEGKLEFTWKLPDIREAPGALRARAEATVFEKGGRPVPNSTTVDFDPYNVYVGIRGPDGLYAKVGSQIPIQTVLVTNDGKPVTGRELNYRIYRNRRWWWYDYDSRDDFRKHFKTDYATDLLEEGKVTTGVQPVEFSFKPTSYGQLLIEVQDGESGHTAAIFLYARDWGSRPASRDADLLSIKTDKEKYYPGDVAKVIVETPDKGRALLTIEKADKVVSTSWHELNSNEMVFEIPITDDMTPNIYAFVTVIQPHSQTTNDRPMRMYGVVPLMVEKPDTRVELQIDAPEEIAPNEKFSVEVRTKDKSQVQYTVAIVDEGLLDLTRFETPDPWEYYYRKEALLVKSYDIFSQFIGANWGEIFKKFSIGGGFAEGDGRDMTSAVKTRRFKPVCMFSGPLLTDSDGHGKVEFTMPEYIGSVRIMVVTAKGKRYGSAEEAIPVKSPLMVMPSLPRVLGPGDEIVVPVTVFAMQDGIGKTEVGIEVEGPLDIVGENKVYLNFKEKDEAEVYFRIHARKAVGVAKIRTYAKAGKEKTESSIDIAVRPQGIWVSATETLPIAKGQEVSVHIPDDALPGTNTATIDISLIEKLELNDRLIWLIRYPYGCVEQTVSSGFPQIYMPEIIEMKPRTARKTTDNVNAAIERLRLYQTGSGAFSYWPGGDRISEWSSTYAGHFMIEAKSRGFFVPDNMYRRWLESEQRAAREPIDKKHHRGYRYLEECYRVYVLALAEKPSMGAMNLLRQNHYDSLSVTSRWLLAASYQLAGSEKVAKSIMDDLGVEVSQYNEFAGTYGSTLRDQAIILEILTLMGDQKRAYPLFRDIAEELSTKRWLSTQTSAYCLLSLGKYVKKFAGGNEELIGEITLPGGTRVKFDTEKPSYSLPIEEGFGGDVKVKLTSSAMAYITMTWRGAPMEDTVATMSSNLKLSRIFLTEDGFNLPINNVKQGETFWCLFSVKNLTDYTIEEIALSQILPAGWEIENTRLSGESYPEWARKYSLGQEEYLDLRDDRANWFFNLNRSRNLDFLLKLNAVTVGEYHLTATEVAAMYNDRFKARIAGKDVSVLEK